MRHARDEDLDRVERLIERIRAAGPRLTEKKRGVFYLKSKAFLHFHEDPQGMFCDVRTLDLSDWDRLCVDEPSACDSVVRRVAALASG